MALRTNLFKTPKHRKYGYVPRYYNPDKEALEEKIKKAELLAEDSIEGTKARIKHQMRKGRSNGEYKSERRKAMIRSNLLLIAIIIILLVGGFMALEVYLPSLIESLD